MKVKNGNLVIIVCVIAVVVLSIVAIRISRANKGVDTSQLSDEEMAAYMNEKAEEKVKKDLAGKGERDRMEYYVSKFVEAVENEKYEEAYEMLYDEFKSNYFPTLDSFKEYVNRKFPKFAALEHTNIERNGNIYILWVKFSDSLGSKDSYIEMNFVVRENDLNDFDLSFQVFE